MSRLLLVVAVLVAAAGCGDRLGDPSTWTQATFDAGQVTFGIPPDWSIVPASTLRDQLQGAIDNGQATGDILIAWTNLVAHIDNGLLLGAVAGRSTGSSASISIIVYVLPAAVDLEATADAALALNPPFANEVVDRREVVQLPLGEAVRVETSIEPVEGIPSRAVEYVALLGDGNAVYINVPAPQGDASLGALAAAFASTLAAP